MARRTMPARGAMPRRIRSTRFIPLVVTWQVVVVVAIVLVLQWQIWSVALAALLLLTAMLLTIPVNGRTLLASMQVRRGFRVRAGSRVPFPDLAPDLVPLGQWLPRLEVTQIKDAHDGEIGVVADGDSWAGILEVSADNSLFTDRGAKLDLAALAALTRHDDVVFAGIQVITCTVPAPSGALLPANSPALQAYREVLGERTPPALRRTWIALRLDPRLCLEAVGRRGSGQVGVFATLRFGLHRAQTTLKRLGVVTEPLDPLGIADVLALTTGATEVTDPDRSHEQWESWVCDGLVHGSRSIGGLGDEPNTAYQRLLDVLNRTPVLFACSSFTVSPGEPAAGALRLVTSNPEQAGQADEYVLANLPGGLRLGPRGGVQVPGLLATIPLGRQVPA